jgi:predicted ATPase
MVEAELHRIKGELLLQSDVSNEPEAESCFLKAIQIARSQNAKTWELRAAISLAQLWRDQSKSQDAREFLEPIYGWFTEGLETADLKDAYALLCDLT